MKAKQTLTASAALAAVAAAYLGRRRANRIREARFDGKCLREAIEAFEGEGGLVIT